MELESHRAASPSGARIFSSQIAGALVRRRVLEWSQETGLPPCVEVSISGKTYELHKPLLVLKSGYFKKELLESAQVKLPESAQVKLPESFPGGPETFEKIVMFLYGSTLSLDPFGIAALRCAAEFLQLAESYGTSNLIERSDLYLNQVVLQNWDDTLIVLQTCQSLLPTSEELLIVSRCIESLAFMSCMEILDPEHRRERPVITLQALAHRPWSCDVVKEMASQELWIKDIIALPFGFFKKIIKSLRRQGMKEKYIIPVISFYANKWVLSKKTEKAATQDASHRVTVILKGVIELLPMLEKACAMVPVGFYFALLSRCLLLEIGGEAKMKLMNQIAPMLYLARSEDLLIPEGSDEPISSAVQLTTMERIISIYLSGRKESGYMQCTPSNGSLIVAELWDQYLWQIAVDPQMRPERFVNLVELMPESDRESHDHLYRSVNTFLLKHPEMTAEEKADVCKRINCQKLSLETCIEAVQNELMPIRLIVQALFAQQLNTHQAFKDCSESFRCNTHCGELSRSLTSFTGQLPGGQTLGGSPHRQASEEVGTTLGFLLHKDIAIQRAELAKAEYESTSFRIQTLEQELQLLRRSLHWQEHISKNGEHNIARRQRFGSLDFDGRTATQKSDTICRGIGCISSVGWASQRKCVSRLLNVFRRLNMFGKGKSKSKQKPPPGFSNESFICRSNHNC